MVDSAGVAGDIDKDVTISAVLTVLRITRVLERIDAGISPQQYRILKLIGQGGERSARLAERLAVAKPTLTATADSLVAAGLVCREAEPGDRRVVRLHLTEAGQVGRRTGRRGLRGLVRLAARSHRPPRCRSWPICSSSTSP